jgi:hypothetical protein
MPPNNFGDTSSDCHPRFNTKPTKLIASALRNPSAKGLYFKRVPGTVEPLYSVRIGLKYRALGLLEGDTIH